MTFQQMQELAKAGVKSQKGLLGMELFRVAAKAGRSLRVVELREMMPRFNVEHMLADLGACDLVASYVVPERRSARVYALTDLGRKLVGLEDAQETKLPAKAKAGEWTKEEIATLGLSSDRVTAQNLGRTEAAVRVKRQALKIPPKDGKWRERRKTVRS